MSARQKNIIWFLLMAVAFYSYFAWVAEAWLRQNAIDPLFANFVVFPFLLGLAAFTGFSGSLTEKVIFFLLVPLAPSLLLFQASDPAKPGLQWLLVAGIQLPYWAGALGSYGVRHFLGKLRSSVQ